MHKLPTPRISTLSDLFLAFVGITVRIRTDPPSSPYPAATWIKLACDIQNAVGRVVYNWTIHCSMDEPSLIYGYYNWIPIPVRDYSLRLRSTPASCADQMMCSAADSRGQATDTWQNEMVYGKLNA